MSDYEVLTDSRGFRYRMVAKDCPFCGPYGPKGFIGVRGGASHRYRAGVETRVVQCMTCSLYFPDPFPEPLDAQEMYGDPEKYFERHDPRAKVAKNLGLLDAFARLLGRSVRSVLDVGSGRGELLEAARSAGIRDVVGLELSRSMIAHCRARNLEVREELVEDHAAAGDRSYDVIFLNAVLEHVPRPDSMLRACRRLIVDDGILYIDLPNEDHLIAEFAGVVNRLRGNPAIFKLSPTWAPYHVMGFNPQAIRMALARCGFVLTELQMSTQLDVPHRGGIVDAAVSRAASLLSRASRPLAMGHNMFVTARPAKVL
ncbi:MAG: class I SAM-dependent methyltransferase [Myxococcota bacterium]